MAWKIQLLEVEEAEALAQSSVFGDAMRATCAVMI